MGEYKRTKRRRLNLLTECAKLASMSLIFLLVGILSLKLDVTELDIWEGLLLSLFLALLAFLYSDKKQETHQSFLIKSVLFYLYASSVVYLFKMTQNINNPDFTWYSLIENNFFPTLPLFILFCTLIGVAVRSLSDRFWNLKLSKILTMSKVTKRFYKSQLLLAVFISQPILVSSFQTSSFFKFETTSQIILSIGRILMVYAVYSFLSYQIIPSLKNIRSGKFNTGLVIAFSLHFGLIFNYLVQLSVASPGQEFGFFVFDGALAFQFISYSILFSTIYFALNRFYLATILNVTIGTLFTIANSLKFQLRQEPILPSDLIWLKEIKLLLGMVDVSYAYLLLTLLIVISVSYYLLLKKAPNEKLSESLWSRLIYLGLSATVIFSVIYSIANLDSNQLAYQLPVVSRLVKVMDIDYKGHAVNSKMKSLTYVWIKQLTTPIMEEPDNYSKEKITEIVEKYHKKAEELNAERQNSLSDQTLIFILSESLSDPLRLSTVSSSEDALTNIKSIMSETTSGLMKSDGYGGGTANMEFQTLTGLPFYNYSPTVSTIYSEVFPGMSIVPAISDHYSEEDRYVLHPEDGNNYNRYTVYKSLKYGNIIFRDNGDEIFTDLKTVGVNTSDKTVYDNILQRLDSTENQFFSIITMQNHIPWSVGEPSGLKVTGEGFSDQQNDQLGNYTRLLYHTDQATEEFLKSLEKLEQKITVVFYGDHLPSFYPQTAFEKDPDNQYLTDYFIWSNWKKEKLDYPLINSSDFIAAMLSYTDSKLSPYYALLTEVLENASVDKEELTDEQTDIASDLKLVQYDISSGKSYLKDYPEFFEILN